MKRKIFLSINIPPRVQKRLVLKTEKWRDLPIKWTKEANLHITLFFLGYVETDILPDICEKVRSAVSEKDMFDLEFEKLELGPDTESPQYVWLTGKASEELRDLHEEIEKSLGIFSRSKKTFRPHITIGRVRSNKWEELEKKPEISENFSLNISVESIDVMASDFKDEESEYVLVEVCPLK